MLQLQTKPIDICRISKLLVKYNVKARITDSVITLYGDVSYELITQLCGNLDITSVQNFIRQEPLYVPQETSFTNSEELTPGENVEKPENVEEPEIVEESEIAEEPEIVEEPKNVEIPQTSPALSDNQPEYDLIYSQVKRGEVYMCDFGKPYGSEQAFERYAIVIQNDVGNLSSPTTIVIACTTQPKKHLPVHYHFKFSSKNMIDYDFERVGSEPNVILAEHIKSVDKTRLRKYLGTLTPEFMKIIQDKIDISLALSRDVKTIVKKEIVYVDRPIPAEPAVKPETPKEHKDVSIVQIQLLSFVDINKLFNISQGDSTDEVKAQKILELFGFDFTKNGVQYLLKAIIASPKNAYFNLETLSKSVSQNEKVDKDEVARLIVARVKETFGFKKAPTIDFIRLVNNFLVK